MNANTTPTWSRPYYGVQHLDGLKDRIQITVEDRGTSADVYGRITVEQIDLFEQTFPTAAQARAFGETRASELQLFARG